MEKMKRTEDQLEDYRKLIHEMTDETQDLRILIKVYTILKYLK